MSVQSSQKLNLDSNQERSFVGFFKSLPEKSPSTVQFFSRGDYYTVHGQDAVFAAKEVFKTTAVIKHMGADDPRGSLEYVVLSKLNFESFVKDLLLVKSYRVEVFVCKPGSSRAGGDWDLEYKASPGNLVQFEDLLFGEGGTALRGEPLSGVLAVRVAGEAKNKLIGIGFVEGTQHRMLVSQFPDSDSFANLEALILQVGPRELLLPSGGDKTENSAIKEVAERCGLLVTERKRTEFNADGGFIQDLGRLLNFKAGQIENVNALPEVALTTATPALAACIRFLELINDSTNFGQFTLSQHDSDQYVRVDGTTVRAVNLKPGPGTQGIGQPYKSLLGLLGQAVRTPQGLRLLLRWLQQPLRDVARLEERLDVVETLRSDSLAMESLGKDYLRGVPDLQALARKLKKRKATLQDLYRIYQSVRRLGGVTSTLQNLGASGQCLASLKALLLDPLTEHVGDMKGYLDMVESTLELDKAAQGSYMIAPSFDDTLKELNERMEELTGDMQKALYSAAGDLNLEANKTIKLENNPQLGYFFRVTLKEEKALRNKSKYITLDTQKAGVRFTSPKLKDLNEEHSGVCVEYEEHQKSLVSEIVDIAAGYADVLCLLSDVLAHVDVLNSFAVAATTAADTYVRPKLLPPGSGVLKFKELRHPCLERLEGIEYVPNNVDFSKDACKMMVLTGPNMGGKSTYIRSVGAAVIMAQVGSFVPAQEAELSLVDSVLARIGAGDCQARGVSTFMAEMLETAAILRVATSNSLVIIDELGRGTSTYDGFGLAWAISEHVAREIGAFCMFATHFHELTSMSQSTPGVENFHVTAETSEGRLTLLYRVRPGPCDQSFGLHVARMAGFPEEVLQGAERQQRELELQHKWVPSEFSNQEDKERKAGEEIMDKFLQDVSQLCEGNYEDTWSKFLKLRETVSSANNSHVKEIINLPEPMECS